MRKFLLFAGIFTVLTYNTAEARGYYEENGYYDNERPRYEQRSERYYRDGSPRYTRSAEEPRQYRRLNREDERRYQEREYARNDYRPQNTIRPYIGVDVATTSVKYGKGKNGDDLYIQNDGEEYFEDGFNAGSIVLGARVNRNWGFEAFYQKSTEEDKEYSDEYYGEETDTASFVAYGIDVQYYIPVNQDFELLASLGLAQYDFEFKAKYKGYYYDDFSDYDDYDEENKKMNKKTTGIRLGIGGQYYLTDNLALRAMARYVKMNDDDYVKNLTEFSLGLRYMF